MWDWPARVCVCVHKCVSSSNRDHCELLKSLSDVIMVGDHYAAAHTQASSALRSWEAPDMVLYQRKV